MSPYGVEVDKMWRRGRGNVRWLTCSQWMRSVDVQCRCPLQPRGIWPRVHDSQSCLSSTFTLAAFNLTSVLLWPFDQIMRYVSSLSLSLSLHIHVYLCCFFFKLLAILFPPFPKQPLYLRPILILSYLQEFLQSLPVAEHPSSVGALSRNSWRGKKNSGEYCKYFERWMRNWMLIKT